MVEPACVIYRADLRIGRDSMDNKIDQKLIDVISRIVAVAKPEKIILFGSRARKDSVETSDFDLLVVKSNAKRRELAQKIYQQLVGIEASVDIIVATPEDLQKYGEASVLVYQSALKDGQVIYAA